MILTEREKWLMQQAWNVSKDYELNTIDDWLNEDTGLNGANTEMLLAHNAPKPESIVKTVDPDNLPECGMPVLYIGHRGLLLVTNLTCSRGKFYANNGFQENITHYIEQKDLIKLLEDSK